MKFSGPILIYGLLRNCLELLLYIRRPAYLSTFYFRSSAELVVLSAVVVFDECIFCTVVVVGGKPAPLVRVAS